MISTAPKVTNAGRELEARAIGGESIAFTRFAIGDGSITDLNSAELTDLISPRLTFEIKDIDKSQKGYIKLTGTFGSKDIKQSFEWRELGLFCKGEDDVETLFAYSNDGDNAGTLRAGGEDVISEQVVSLTLAVENADNVTAILSDSVLYAKKSELDAETSARKTANTDLQKAIEREAQERTAADSALQTALDTEVTARQGEDAKLQTTINANKESIAAETSARETADSDLQKAIDAETVARGEVDANLQKEINNIKSDTDTLINKVFGQDMPKTWKDVQYVVRSGRAAQYFDIGDQFVVERLIGVTVSVGDSADITDATVDANAFVDGMGETKAGEYVFTFDNHAWHDKYNGAVKLSDYGITVTGKPKAGDTITVTETTEELVWDVIGIDHDTPADENYTHSMTLQLHDVFADMVFDSKEAIVYVDSNVYPDGIAPGMYTIDCTDKAGGLYYCFALETVVPVGGQITMSDSEIITYASVSSVAALEIVSYTNPTEPTGTVITALENSYSNSVNNIDRAQKGSGNWITSEIRQWLNSAGDANTWWNAQTVFDRPGSTAEQDGFLKNLDPAFLDVVGTVIKNTRKYSADGGGSVDAEERFFLLSRTEAYVGDKRYGEGEVYTYYGDEYSKLSKPGTSSDANRIKYRDGSAAVWWLRSYMSDNYSYSPRFISSSGSSLIAHSASAAHGAAPACVIV